MSVKAENEKKEPETKAPAEDANLDAKNLDDPITDPVDESKPNEQDPKSAESDEVLITHADDAESVNVSKKVPRRVRKLLDRNDQLKGELSNNQDVMSEKDAENQLLRMQLVQMNQSVQKKEKAVKPTMESCGFDEGKYDSAMQTFTRSGAESVFSEKIGELQQQQNQQAIEQQKNKAIGAHYERADALKVKDYDEAEEAAVSVLGSELVQNIAASADDSHTLIYYLGKNKAKAEELKLLFANDPAKATYALGKLAAGLTIKPVTKKSTPDIDSPLEGGGGGGSSAWETKLKHVRAEARKTGNISPILRLKEEAKAAGVTLL